MFRNFKKYAIANKSVIALAISLLFLAACGDDSSSNSSDGNHADEDDGDDGVDTDDGDGV